MGSSKRHARYHRLAFVLAAPIATVAVAQTPSHKVVETPSNFVDQFGAETAAQGDLLVVSEWVDDFSGSIHLFAFHQEDWVETQKLIGSYSHVGQLLGDALALDGATILAGAPHDDMDGVEAGAVYIFSLVNAGMPSNPLDDVYAQTARLKPQSAAPAMLFGKDVALAGNTAAIGAPGYSGMTGVSYGDGAVYVFERDDMGTADPVDDLWFQQAELRQSPQLLPSDRFGQAVLLTDDAQMLLVADAYDPAIGKGTITPFHRDDNGTPANPFDDVWQPGAKIIPDLFAGVGGFRGPGLLLDGDRLFCQASDTNGESVVVFDRSDSGTPTNPLDDTWTQSASIDSGFWFGFGSEMAFVGGQLLVSRGISSFPTTGRVSVYEEVGSSWTLVDTLLSPEPQMNTGFGTSITAVGDRVFIGAPGAKYVDDWAPLEGAVHAYRWTVPSPWSGQPEGVSGLPNLGAWGCLTPGTPTRLRVYNGFGWRSPLSSSATSPRTSPRPGGPWVQILL